MPQQYKIDKVQNLKAYFDNSQFYVFNNFSGLTVEKITNLRRDLRKFNSQFIVIKNNYIKRIIKDKNIPEMDTILAGPTAVTFIQNDLNESLKILFNYTKETTLKVKGGWVYGNNYDEKGLESISKLPGKNQLIAIFMATLNAPVQNFVYSCNDVVGRFVRVLNAVGEKKKAS